MRALGVKSLTSLLFLFVAAGLAQAQSQDTVLAKAQPDGSSILTDGQGMTLYYYTKDANGKSASTGQVEKAWPSFYAASISVSPPLKAEDFGTITRDDGSKQTTYHGWPMYYWFKDKAPGDMSGEGVGKVWYVFKAPAYTVMIGTSPALGNYLVDGEGNALYYFTKDSSGKSACNGDCIKNWPAFTASGFVLPSGLNPADFGTIRRSDGTSQVTYKGYPLYYWKKDGMRGDVTGQGVGKVWYVVDPEKFTAGEKM
jgi:predicted lipoprotein with Yx(FWY)xxD motif